MDDSENTSYFIILEVFYCIHSNNIQVAALNYKSLIGKTFDRNTCKMKASSPSSKKVKKITEGNVSIYFSIGCALWFCAPMFCVPDRVR